MDDKRARFDAEVMPHLDAAYRYARWMSRTANDVDDVVQDAVLRAFRAFDGLRGSDARAWLLAIVRNCHLTLVAQQQRRGHVPLPEANDERDGHAMISTLPGPESAAMRREDARLLERLMSELPEEHREVLALREIEDLGYRDIAALINVPIGTVMSRLARARAALRDVWRRAAGEDDHVMP